MQNKIRVAILYSGLSGYLASCFRAYKKLYNPEFLIIHWPISSEAPFKQSDFEDLGNLVEKNGKNSEYIYKKLEEFKPNVIITSGWMDNDYLRFCRIFKKRGVLAIAGCDTQANGSFRQYLAGIIAPYYLHKSIDVLWVTGERQRQLAYKLGFKGNKCWDGFYSCDWNSFSQIYPSEKNNSFLYVGRLIERKGIRTLIEAYQNYRNETINPWNLVIAGTGPLSKLFAPIEGISHLGFVQPNGLPDLFSKSKVFILPSEVEPWGVVLHEAITAGLPILTTNESGAGVHLVKNGFNGFKYDANDTEALTYYLSFFSRQNEDNWKIMSSNSKLLSKLYTPNLWAETLQTGLKELLPHA